MAPCITLSERQVVSFAVELIGPRPFDGRRTQFGRHYVVQPGAISACRWRIRRAGGTSRNTRDATIEMKPQPQTSPQEVLAGLIERVTYHNAENGFCVLRAKARGHRDVVTVVGHAAAIAAGEWITASGEWVNDRTHGQQFKARFLKTWRRTRRTRDRDQVVTAGFFREIIFAGTAGYDVERPATQ